MGLDDGSVERGVENVIHACLRVAPGELVTLMLHDVDDLGGLFEKALVRAGATVKILPLEPWVGRTTATAAPGIAAAITGTAASLTLARRLPGPISLASLQAARRVGSRHLHAIGAERRLVAQSYRADPDKLSALNDELRRLLLTGHEVAVRSPTGTQLRVGLAAAYPVISLNGRPSPDAFDNLPAGFLLLHPSTVDGTFVADRALVSSGLDLDPLLVRRAAPVFRFTRGKVDDFTCSDPQLTTRIQAYLDSHAFAGRVGTVWLPTNYLVRNEIGVGPQDALLPGLVIALGFSAADRTRANWDAPVQLRLLGRRQTLELGGRVPVRDGRFEPWFTDGSERRA